MDDNELKLSHKERHNLWKKAKKAKRDAEIKYYQHAPFLVKFWNLYIKKFFHVAIFVFILLFITYYVNSFINQYITIHSYEMIQKIKKEPLTEEQKLKIYEESPIDSEGLARVKALPKIGKDETWTICLYMDGSDLEDHGNNYFSELAKFETNKINKDNIARRKDNYYKNLERFKNELHDSGLELPNFFYYPNIPIESNSYECVNIELPGAG